MERTQALATAFAGARGAFGLALYAAPERVASGWLGAIASTLLVDGDRLPKNAKWGTVALAGASVAAAAALIAALES
jgi:hypothetical protein